MESESIERVIREEALSVLQDIGVECTDERVINTFESTQMAAYDPTTQRIHLTPALVKACVDAAPKRGKFPIPEHSFGGGGVALYVERGDDYIIPKSEIHVAEMMDIAESFSIPFMFKGVSAKFTATEEEKQIDIMRRYYSGYLYIRTETDVGIKKAREEFDDTGKICTTHSPLISPLKFNETYKDSKAVDNIELLYKCVHQNLPIYLTTMPITCLSGPATLYGIALQAYCEFLVGLCLVQILNPGLLVVNGAYPAAGDPLRYYAPALGSISHNMANWLTAKVSEVDHLPSLQSGCTISTKRHNPIEQGTDIETEKGYKFWNRVSNWHQVRHSFGFIDLLAAFKFDKMQRDLQALRRIQENKEMLDVNFQDIVYDPEAYTAIEYGVEADDFRGLHHTTKNVGILDEFQISEEYTKENK